MYRALPRRSDQQLTRGGEQGAGAGQRGGQDSQAAVDAVGGGGGGAAGEHRHDCAADQGQGERGREGEG